MHTKTRKPASPFAGLGTKRQKSRTPIDVDLLKITRDPYVRRSSPKQSSIYDPLFANMQSGQCIVCATDEVDRVSAALRKHLERNGLRNAAVRAVQRYPTDQMGRVWLLDKGEVR